MEILVYIARCIMVFLVTWAGLRMLGKKPIAQMTSYELAGVLLLTTVAAEPLVYKVVSKASVGVLTLSIIVLITGRIALSKKFYDIDSKPLIIVSKGQIDKEALKHNRINLPFLLSLLRTKGYSKISEVEYAIIEPDGTISVIPKSQERPVKPKDLKIQTEFEGLALPLIIDGIIQNANLQYAGLDTQWLKVELSKYAIKDVHDVFLAEIDAQGQLYIDLNKDQFLDKPPLV